MAIEMVGAGDKRRFFCHSCGGLTVYLTEKEAFAEKSHGHDLEAFPLTGQPQDQAFRTIQAEQDRAVNS